MKPDRRGAQPPRPSTEPKEKDMKAPNTWKDSVGCVAVLLAIVLSTVSGAYSVYVESTPVAQAGVSFHA
jgi:hypothetical protein